MASGVSEFLQQLKERVADAYLALEDRYYSLIDWLVERGVPADRLVEAIEEKGVPSFPIFLLTLIILVGGIGWAVWSFAIPHKYVVTLYGPDGMPLANTTVTINGETYTTDEFGRVELEGIDGPVSVEIDGYKPFTLDPAVQKDVFLKAETKKVTITVRDRTSGATVEDVKITVEGDGQSKEFSTNPAVFHISRVSGTSAIKTHEDGSITVKIESPRYSTKTVTINWSDGDDKIVKTVYLVPNSVTGSSNSRGDIVVYIKPTNVYGTVTAYKNDVVVTKLPFQDGKVVLPNLPYGMYRLVFEPEINGITIENPANQMYVNHHSIETHARITLYLPEYEGDDEYVPPEDLKQYYAVVTVLNKAGSPIKGARLYSSDGTPVAGPADDKGIITLGFDSEDAELNVYVGADGYYSSEYFIIHPEDTKKVVLTPMPSVGKLKICVDEPWLNNQYAPVPYAYYQIVSIESPQWSKTGNVGGDGCATIENVPAGDVNITAMYPTAEFPTTVTANVEAHKTTEVTIHLSRKVSVSIHVRRQEDGSPVYASVAALDSMENVWASGATTPNGDVLLQVPAYVPIHFKVTYGPNYTYQTQTYTFTKDGEITINVPGERKNRAEISDIVDTDGHRTFMLAPKRTYYLVVNVTCAGKCSLPVRAYNGVTTSAQTIDVDCGGTMCSRTFYIPVKAAEGIGAGTVEINGTRAAVPYGFELLGDESGATIYTDFIALRAGTRYGPQNLVQNMEYKMYIPFAVKAPVDESASVSVKGGRTHVENVQLKILGRVGDYSVGYALFKGYSETSGNDTLIFNLEDAYTAYIDIHYSRLMGNKPLHINVSPVNPVAGCSEYPVEYNVTDDVDSVTIVIYSKTMGFSTGTIRKAPPSGTINIPTNLGVIDLNFVAPGYKPVGVSISPQDVEIKGIGNAGLHESDGLGPGPYTGTVVYTADMPPEANMIEVKGTTGVSRNFRYIVNILESNGVSPFSGEFTVTKAQNDWNNTTTTVTLAPDAYVILDSGGKCKAPATVEITINEYNDGKQEVPDFNSEDTCECQEGNAIHTVTLTVMKGNMFTYAEVGGILCQISDDKKTATCVLKNPSTDYPDANVYIDGIHVPKETVKLEKCTCPQNGQPAKETPEIHAFATSCIDGNAIIHVVATGGELEDVNAYTFVNGHKVFGKCGTFEDGSAECNVPYSGSKITIEANIGGKILQQPIQADDICELMGSFAPELHYSIMGSCDNGFDVILYPVSNDAAATIIDANYIIGKNSSECYTLESGDALCNIRKVENGTQITFEADINVAGEIFHETNTWIVSCQSVEEEEKCNDVTFDHIADSPFRDSDGYCLVPVTIYSEEANITSVGSITSTPDGRSYNCVNTVYTTSDGEVNALDCNLEAGAEYTFQLSYSNACTSDSNSYTVDLSETDCSNVKPELSITEASCSCINETNVFDFSVKVDYGTFVEVNANNEPCTILKDNHSARCEVNDVAPGDAITIDANVLVGRDYDTVSKSIKVECANGMFCRKIELTVTQTKACEGDVNVIKITVSPSEGTISEANVGTVKCTVGNGIASCELHPAEEFLNQSLDVNAIVTVDGTPAKVTKSITIQPEGGRFCRESMPKCKPGIVRLGISGACSGPSIQTWKIDVNDTYTIEGVEITPEYAWVGINQLLDETQAKVYQIHWCKLYGIVDHVDVNVFVKNKDTGATCWYGWSESGCLSACKAYLSPEIKEQQCKCFHETLTLGPKVFGPVVYDVNINRNIYGDAVKCNLLQQKTKKGTPYSYTINCDVNWMKLNTNKVPIELNVGYGGTYRWIEYDIIEPYDCYCDTPAVKLNDLRSRWMNGYYEVNFTIAPAYPPWTFEDIVSPESLSGCCGKYDAKKDGHPCTIYWGDHDGKCTVDSDKDIELNIALKKYGGQYDNRVYYAKVTLKKPNALANAKLAENQPEPFCQLMGVPTLPVRIVNVVGDVEEVNVGGCEVQFKQDESDPSVLDVNVYNWKSCAEDIGDKYELNIIIKADAGSTTLTYDVDKAVVPICKSNVRCSAVDVEKIDASASQYHWVAAISIPADMEGTIKIETNTGKSWQWVPKFWIDADGNVHMYLDNSVYRQGEAFRPDNAKWVELNATHIDPEQGIAEFNIGIVYGEICNEPGIVEVNVVRNCMGGDVSWASAKLNCTWWLQDIQYKDHEAPQTTLNVQPLGGNIGPKEFKGCKKNDEYYGDVQITLKCKDKDSGCKRICYEVKPTNPMPGCSEEISWNCINKDSAKIKLNSGVSGCDYAIHYYSKDYAGNKEKEQVEKIHVEPIPVQKILPYLDMYRYLNVQLGEQDNKLIGKIKVFLEQKDINSIKYNLIDKTDNTIKASRECKDFSSSGDGWSTCYADFGIRAGPPRISNTYTINSEKRTIFVTSEGEYHIYYAQATVIDLCENEASKNSEEYVVDLKPPELNVMYPENCEFDQIDSKNYLFCWSDSIGKNPIKINARATDESKVRISMSLGYYPWIAHNECPMNYVYDDTATCSLEIDKYIDGNELMVVATDKNHNQSQITGIFVYTCTSKDKCKYIKRMLTEPTITINPVEEQRYMGPEGSENSYLKLAHVTIEGKCDAPDVNITAGGAEYLAENVSKTGNYNNDNIYIDYAKDESTINLNIGLSLAMLCNMEYDNENKATVTLTVSCNGAEESANITVEKPAEKCTRACKYNNPTINDVHIKENKIVVVPENVDSCDNWAVEMDVLAENEGGYDNMGSVPASGADGNAVLDIFSIWESIEECENPEAMENDTPVEFNFHLLCNGEELAYHEFNPELTVADICRRYYKLGNVPVPPAEVRTRNLEFKLRQDRKCIYEVNADENKVRLSDTVANNPCEDTWCEQHGAVWYLSMLKTGSEANIDLLALPNGEKWKFRTVKTEIYSTRLMPPDGNVQYGEEICKKSCEGIANYHKDYLGHWICSCTTTKIVDYNKISMVEVKKNEKSETPPLYAVKIGDKNAFCTGQTFAELLSNPSDPVALHLNVAVLQANSEVSSKCNGKIVKIISAVEDDAVVFKIGDDWYSIYGRANIDGYFDFIAGLAHGGDNEDIEKIKGIGGDKFPVMMYVGNKGIYRVGVNAQPQSGERVTCLYGQGARDPRSPSQFCWKYYGIPPLQSTNTLENAYMTLIGDGVGFIWGEAAKKLNLPIGRASTESKGFAKKLENESVKNYVRAQTEEQPGGSGGANTGTEEEQVNVTVEVPLVVIGSWINIPPLVQKII